MRHLEVLIKVPVPEQHQLQRRRTEGASKRIWFALIAAVLIAYTRSPRQSSTKVADGQFVSGEAKRESSAAVIVSEPEAEGNNPPQETAVAETAAQPATRVPAESRAPVQNIPPVQRARVPPVPAAVASQSSSPAARVVPRADAVAVNSVVPPLNPPQLNPTPQVAEARRSPENAVRPVTSEFLAGKLIRKVVPPYPALARRNRISGTVILRAIISEQGKIRDLRVESGPALLIDAARDAVRQWEYQPWILDGKPVQIESTIDVIFKLRSSQDQNSVR